MVIRITVLFSQSSLQVSHKRPSLRERFIWVHGLSPSQCEKHAGVVWDIVSLCLQPGRETNAFLQLNFSFSPLNSLRNHGLWDVCSISGFLTSGNILQAYPELCHLSYSKGWHLRRRINSHLCCCWNGELTKENHITHKYEIKPKYSPCPLEYTQIYVRFKSRLIPKLHSSKCSFYWFLGNSQKVDWLTW